MADQDYYETLHLSPIADQTVIAAAYRRLALLYHPDRNNSAEATETMARINVAYETLRDPKRRAEYDRERTGTHSSGSGRTNQNSRQTGNRYGSGTESSRGEQASQRTGQTASGYSRSRQSTSGRRESRDGSRRQTNYEGEPWTTYSRNGPRPEGDQGNGMGFFGLGANRETVEDVQGRAERVNVNHVQNKETWYYGRSTVEFSLSTGTVRRWADLARNLRVRMVPGQKATSSPTFGLGSHKDDVLRLQGTPSRIDLKAANRETWCFGYGYSTVDFQNPAGLVVGWQDIEKILNTAPGGGQRSHASGYDSSGTWNRKENRPYGQPSSEERRTSDNNATGGPNSRQGDWQNQNDRYRSTDNSAPGGAEAL